MPLTHCLPCAPSPCHDQTPKHGPRTRWSSSASPWPPCLPTRSRGRPEGTALRLLGKMTTAQSASTGAAGRTMPRRAGMGRRASEGSRGARGGPRGASAGLGGQSPSLIVPLPLLCFLTVPLALLCFLIVPLPLLCFLIISIPPLLSFSSASCLSPLPHLYFLLVPFPPTSLFHAFPSLFLACPPPPPPLLCFLLVRPSSLAQCLSVPLNRL